MQKVAIAVAIAAVVLLGACQKTGEGEYEVQRPTIGTTTDTLRAPSVEVGSDTHTVAVPNVDIRTDSGRLNVDVRRDSARVVTPKVKVTRP